jgi:hypothetical protein
MEIVLFIDTKNSVALHMDSVSLSQLYSESGTAFRAEEAESHQ